MKVLIVSNLYPPHYLGGYEIRCAQVAEALQRAGHEVQVITSEYQVAGGGESARRKRREVRNGVVVHRCLREYIFTPLLHLRPWAYFQARRELQDAHHFQRIVREFQPDVINWWSMLGLSKLLLPLPCRWGIPEVYWIEQSWLIDQVGTGGSIVGRFWQDFWEGKWGFPAPRALTRGIGQRWEARAVRHDIETRNFSVQPQHVCFVSEYMSRLHHKSGLILPSSEVIHGGVSVEEFLAPVRTTTEADPLRLLYAGQLSPDRGLHTVVEALGLLPPFQRGRVTLRVAGEGQRPYLARVKALVQALGLREIVSFAGKVPHAEISRFYREHDILVFPSERHEGLPLTMIEAMLSGCAVLTTGAGGSGEIADLAELPTFPPGDTGRLASLLGRMITNRVEVARIALHGQRIARSEFSLEKMMDRFQGTLGTLTGSRRAVVGVLDRRALSP